MFDCFSSTDMTTQLLLSYNGTSLSSNITSVSSNITSLSSNVVPLSCFFMENGKTVFTAFALTYFLLSVPPCLYVLFLVLHRCWQQRSSSASPADVFAVHIAAVTLIGVFGCLVACCGLHGNKVLVASGGLHCWLFCWYGETFFHILTCLERYFAVAHPILYLKLKSERGIFIRNICFVCVWLFCLGRSFMTVFPLMNAVLDIIGQIVSLIIAIVCNFFVFHILIRPTPGKQDRDGANRTKQKAFIIILAIAGTLFLRFVSNLALYSYSFLSSIEKYNCDAVFVAIWFNIPSSLVIPLLFLHRAWK